MDSFGKQDTSKLKNCTGPYPPGLEKINDTNQ